MTIHVNHSVTVRSDGDTTQVIIGGITQMSVPLNTQVSQEVTAGSPYAQQTNVTEQKPTIQFSTRDAAKAKLTGLIGTHENSILRFRKRSGSSDSGFVADNVAEHISITAAGLLTVDNAHSANASAAGEMALKINVKYDGINVPLVMPTTATLTPAE